MTDTKGHRGRATQADMSEREAQVIALVKNSEEPVTLKDVQKQLGISYPSTANIVQRLVQRRELDIIGRRSRNYLLAAVKEQQRHVITVDDGRDEPVAQAEPQVQEVQELGTVDSNSILTALHFGLGGDLKVAGFHMVEGERPILDLKTTDGEVLSVTVMSPSN